MVIVPLVSSTPSGWWHILVTLFFLFYDVALNQIFVVETLYKLCYRACRRRMLWTCSSVGRWQRLVDRPKCASPDPVQADAPHPWK